MAVGFPTKANWAAGDVLTAAQMDDLAGTVNTLANVPPRNAVLNSNFSVWQRGTSIALSGFAVYGADRWMIWDTGNATGMTVSRQATNDTTNLPNIQYCARYQRNAGQTTTSSKWLYQSFESVNSIPFVGKTVTLSFYARAGANFSSTGNQLNVQLATGTGTDQNWNVTYTGAATPINQYSVLTTTWQRFSYTGTLASTATELSTVFGYSSTGTAGANDYFEVTGVQLELGSTASTFYPNQPTYATELVACQRYLPAITATGSADIAIGYAYATNLALYSLALPVQARVAPTGITVSGTFAGYGLNVSTTVTPTFAAGSLNTIEVAASPTIVAGQGSRLATSGAGSILMTGCEL